MIKYVDNDFSSNAFSPPNHRSVSTYIFLQVSQNGSLSIGSYPQPLNYDLKDVFKMSVGPRDNYDGIKSCLTYNPPGGFRPGYQTTRGVSTHDGSPHGIFVVYL